MVPSGAFGRGTVYASSSTYSSEGLGLRGAAVPGSRTRVGADRAKWRAGRLPGGAKSPASVTARRRRGYRPRRGTAGAGCWVRGGSSGSSMGAMVAVGSGGVGKVGWHHRHRGGQRYGQLGNRRRRFFHNGRGGWRSRWRRGPGSVNTSFCLSVLEFLRRDGAGIEPFFQLAERIEGRRGLCPWDEAEGGRRQVRRYLRSRLVRRARRRSSCAFLQLHEAGVVEQLHRVFGRFELVIGILLA